MLTVDASRAPRRWRLRLRGCRRVASSPASSNLERAASGRKESEKDPPFLCIRAKVGGKMGESRTDLMAWLNDLLQLNYTRLEQVGESLKHSFLSNSLNSRRRDGSRLLSGHRLHLRRRTPLPLQIQRKVSDFPSNPPLAQYSLSPREQTRIRVLGQLQSTPKHLQVTFDR